MDAKLSPDHEVDGARENDSKAETAADIRYSLTPLGEQAVAGSQRFRGFGPCAGSCARGGDASATRAPRRARGRRAGALPLAST